MSNRSYSKLWVHLIWGTHNREKMLSDQTLREALSKYLFNYSKVKDIYMKENFVNSDHVHVLINLPPNQSVADVAKLFKGSSSFWLNNKIDYKFSWAKGYGAFSISHSQLDQVVNYIRNQEEHHKFKSFGEEYSEFLNKYDLEKNR